MDKVISSNNGALDVTFNLRTYLESEFDFVYNHNNFFIVGTNDKPINSLPNTTGEDIWLKIIDYVKELLIEPSFPGADRFYKKLTSNYVLAYGSRQFLNSKNDIVLDKFNRTIVPIFSDNSLYYDYINNDISITRLDTIIWKPIGFSKKYNTILETVFKIILNTLNLVYPAEWSFDKLDNLHLTLLRDVEDGYHIPHHFDIKKALKNYIYQVWIFTINKKTSFLSSSQKKIQALLKKYSNKGIPLHIASNVTKRYEVGKKIIYRETASNKFISNSLLFYLIIFFVILLILITLKLFNVF